MSLFVSRVVQQLFDSVICLSLFGATVGIVASAPCDGTVPLFFELSQIFSTQKSNREIQYTLTIDP